jgi:hypothetical protein
MPREGFETATPVFQRSKTVGASGCAANGTGIKENINRYMEHNNQCSEEDGRVTPKMKCILNITSDNGGNNVHLHKVPTWSNKMSPRTFQTVLVVAPSS